MYIKKDGEVFVVSITGKEKEIIINSFVFLSKDLDGEFFTRLGFYESEYEILSEAIKKDKEIYNETELLMIHQALNEICHGVFNTDFVKTIGSSLADVKIIFNTIDRVFSKN